MTKQETFDAMVRGVIAQGGAAFNATEKACRYRATAADGSCRKCAAEHLIPDDRYTSDIDRSGQVVNNVAVSALLIDELGHDLDVVWSVQDAHDQAAGHMVDDVMMVVPDDVFLTTFRAKVRTLAEHYKLSAEACA